MQKLKCCNDQCGSALIASVVIGLIFSIVGIGVVRLVTRGSELRNRDVTVIKSYWANEAIMRVALRYLSLKTESRGQPAFFTSTPQTFSISGLTVNGFVSGSTLTASIASPRQAVYTVTAQAPVDGVNLVNRTVCSDIPVKSLQRYTFFEKQGTADDIWWRNFVVRGDFHSNGNVRLATDMSASSHVWDEATTAGTLVKTYPEPYSMGILVQDDGTATASWLQERFPQYAHIGQVQTSALDPDSFSTGITVTHAGQIALYLKGNTVEAYTRSGAVWSYYSSYPVNGTIIKTTNETVVWGTLDGRLTVVGPKNYDMLLGGNITYAQTNLATSDDVLALVSGRDIIVPVIFKGPVIGGVPYQYDFSAAANSQVYGSLLMDNGTFSIDGLETYTALRTLTLYGSVLVNTDIEKILEMDDGSGGISYIGMNCVYIRDVRYYTNSIAAPGLPFPKSEDEERSDYNVSSLKYMWVLGNGQWKNVLARVN